MLYVFHVDFGRMMSFDMTVALSSVDNLKHTIERLHGITAGNIVLLVSGGEMLTQNTQVSYYSAGTDTNPIYMFLTGDFKLPPAISQQTEMDLDLREQIERCLQLPPVYETVQTRAHLASRLQDLAREEERVCERLVHDQHLQQQGWSAVVANMEDLTAEFKQRCHNFFAAFDRHLEQRGRYLELLHNFGDDLAQLARIPILPGLMVLAAEDFHGFDDYLDTDEVFARSQTQQESVLMTAADEKSKSTAVTDNTGTQLSSEENITVSSDDKNSTSPNKKLKMGNERGDDQIGSSQQQSTDIATTSATAAATTTVATTNATSSTSIRNSNLNLLQWITSKESHNRTWGSDHNTLKLISDECIQGLSTFNEDIYEKLKTEMQHIIKLAEQNDVKEIKGISERLCRLEDFKYTVKKMVQDQKELSMSFQLNQNRVSNVRDPSVLPDLCESHKSSLSVMMQKHNKILEHRRCIAKAKDELGTNLHMRLKRIVWLENAMSDIDNRLLFYHRCLRRAEKHITIIEQIHQTPCIYVAAVTEVVRRKIFSGEFRQWASKLAEDFDVIHSEEIRRRQLFNSSFEGHFLNILFPGMTDMPPAFANETPLIFDARLPNITKSDIDLLSTHLPTLASQIELPDMGPVINFFVSRSGVHQKERMEELLKQQVAAVMNNLAGDGIGDNTSKPLQPQRLNELQKEAAGGTCCDESETDTETEFEKVVASMQTVATSTSENQPPEQMARSTITEALPLTQSAATLTDETLDSEASARAEVERLRGLLAALSKLTVDCLQMSRANVQSIRLDAQKYSEDLQSELQILAEKLDLLRMQSHAREHELNENNAEQQQEREVLRNKVMGLERELHELRLLKEAKDSEHCQLEKQLTELQQRVKTAEEDMEHAIAATRDQMRNEHETEIESLRCRFKLMTSMEASTKCTDVIDVQQHEAMMAQLRSTLESEKERAISTAIEMERSLWQSKYFPLNSDSVMVKMLEDKERQLDQLREKDTMLTKENFQLKARLDALTNEEGNSWLLEKIEYLLRDKTRLQDELTAEKSRRMEMEASLRSSVNALPRSISSGSSHKYIVVDSCAKDDVVFVVWSMRHRQFMVVQDSPHIYFVHGDSLAGLNLRLPRSSESGGGVASAADELPIPLPYYAIGRVVEKEYCQARKDENRYRVSKGSKFYRIKLMPLSKLMSRRDRMESFSSCISRSISQCESQSESVAITGAMTSTLHVASKAITAITSTPPIATSTSPANTAKYDVVDAPSTSAAAVGIFGGGGAAAAGISGHGIGVKERTISITSVTEEDDEPVSLLGEQCRYISVSEEDEPPIGSSPTTVAITTVVAAASPPPPLPLSSASSLTASTTSSLSKILQQSVITEQPTALSTLKRDLLLASADIIPQQEQSQVSPQQERDNAAAAALNTTITCTDTDITSVSDIMSTTITDMATSTLAANNPTVTMTTPDGGNVTDPSSPTTIPPSLVGTAASEDSDEYRSLEAKDDTDFPISE